MGIATRSKDPPDHNLAGGVALSSSERSAGHCLVHAMTEISSQPLRVRSFFSSFVSFLIPLLSFCMYFMHTYYIYIYMYTVGGQDSCLFLSLSLSFSLWLPQTMPPSRVSAGTGRCQTPLLSPSWPTPFESIPIAVVRMLGRTCI